MTQLGELGLPAQSIAEGSCWCGLHREFYGISSWLAPARRAELFVSMPVPAEYCICQGWHPNRLRGQKQEVFKIISHGPESFF